MLVSPTHSGEWSWVTFCFRNGVTPSEPPRMQYDTALSFVDAATLQRQLGVYELYGNMTNRSDPSSNEPTGWTVRFSEGKRGRVSVQPSMSAQAGTVCSTKYQFDAAEAFCRSANAVFDVAIAIPYFGGGAGFIYLDEVDVP